METQITSKQKGMGLITSSFDYTTLQCSEEIQNLAQSVIVEDVAGVFYFSPPYGTRIYLIRLQTDLYPGMLMPEIVDPGPSHAVPFL